MLAATGAVGAEEFASVVLLGELGLDGRLRPVRGVLPCVAAAARRGLRRVVVPEGNAAEARLVPGVEVYGLRSLRQLVALAQGGPMPDDGPDDDAGAAHAEHGRAERAGEEERDLADVLGQRMGRWALEVAAAGGHHLFLLGPPGAGKTMLAERLPGLLPDLAPEEALEVTAVHSVAGVLRPGVPLVTRPPFQAPHHTASVAAIIGGGSGMPRPGAASVCHRGVLLLDEAPEFASRALEALREPLESGEIVLSRSGGSARYPARFRLVLAANPCPCGLSIGKGLECRCLPQAKRRYLMKLSGPLLDRIDLRLTVPALTRADLSAGRSTREGTAAVAARVREARARAEARFAGLPWRANAEMPGRDIRRRFPPHPGAVDLLERRLLTGQLTMRGADRILRVAWTVADLAGRDRPGPGEVSAAMSLREMEVERT